jgi:hypothetical protein
LANLEYLPDDDYYSKDAVHGYWRTIICPASLQAKPDNEHAPTLGDVAAYEQIHLIMRRERYYHGMIRMSPPTIETDEPINVQDAAILKLDGSTSLFGSWLEDFFSQALSFHPASHPRPPH